MTIANQIFTEEQNARQPWILEPERTQRTKPITPEQIKYIMTLLWNKGIHGGHWLPASTNTGVPTAADLEQYNRAQASKAIDILKECSFNNGGILWERERMIKLYNYSKYLGELPDIDEEIAY